MSWSTKCILNVLASNRSIPLVARQSSHLDTPLLTDGHYQGVCRLIQEGISRLYRAFSGQDRFPFAARKHATCQEHAPAHDGDEEDAGLGDELERAVDVEKRENVLQGIP